MARPLTKQKDGVRYTRPAVVEGNIDDALGADPATLRRRLLITDKSASGYLRSECLVHLTRHAHRNGDDKTRDAVLPVLLGRCEVILGTKVSDRLPNAVQLREDVLSEFCELLLAEERDLRQVPAAALHIDAVRLMTIHGSKGLEFEAVHVPGLTASSFPANNRGQRCPPPIGMIDGADAISVTEEAKRAHANEEECLFFVALSRARTHLRLHLARKQPNGKNRSESSFLGWLPAGSAQEIARPGSLPLPPGSPRPAPITVSRAADWSLTDSRLTSYEKCPRRYFYTHVLGLGGARERTAFTQTHDCLYELIRWLADARRTSEPTLAEAEAAFEAIWQERGPIEHAFRDDYRRLAARLVAALIRAGAGRRFRESEPLAIDLPNGRVLVEPNELAELSDGSVVVRRVRTGQKRSDEYDRLEYTLYQLAAQARFGGAVVVQALHLTDETAEAVTITAAKVSNRRTKSDEMLGRIAAGWFPPEVDAVTCPRCPHFFICAATPQGSLVVS